MNTPIGVAIGGDNRMLCRFLNTVPSIEVYGLSGYTGGIAFSVYPVLCRYSGRYRSRGTNSYIWNSGTGALDWSTKTSTTDGAKWLSATQSGSAGAGGSANVSVSVKTCRSRSRRSIPAP